MWWFTWREGTWKMLHHMNHLQNYINKLMIAPFWHFHFDNWIGENVLGCATQMHSIYGKHWVVLINQKHSNDVTAVFHWRVLYVSIHQAHSLFYDIKDFFTNCCLLMLSLIFVYMFNVSYSVYVFCLQRAPDPGISSKGNREQTGPRRGGLPNQSGRSTELPPPLT